MSVQIGGIQKLTLLDYPGKTACTVFLNGCNYRCPFCHNRSLVLPEEFMDFMSEEDLLEFLATRKNKLDGVCISGGEPLLQNDIESFVNKIHSAGFLVKLDTNGYLHDRLRSLVEAKKIDYIAMDVKNSLAKYSATSGIDETSFHPEWIEASVQLLKGGTIPHEFRTTVVKELHQEKDLLEIAQWVKGDPWYLQTFEPKGSCIQVSNLSAYSLSEMKALVDKCKTINSKTKLRGEE